MKLAGAAFVVVVTAAILAWLLLSDDRRTAGDAITWIALGVTAMGLLVASVIEVGPSAVQTIRTWVIAAVLTTGMALVLAIAGQAFGAVPVVLGALAYSVFAFRAHRAARGAPRTKSAS